MFPLDKNHLHDHIQYHHMVKVLEELWSNDGLRSFHHYHHIQVDLHSLHDLDNHIEHYLVDTIIRGYKYEDQEVHQYIGYTFCNFYHKHKIHHLQQPHNQKKEDQVQVHNLCKVYHLDHDLHT